MKAMIEFTSLSGLATCAIEMIDVCADPATSERASRSGSRARFLVLICAVTVGAAILGVFKLAGNFALGLMYLYFTECV